MHLVQPRCLFEYRPRQKTDTCHLSTSLLRQRRNGSAIHTSAQLDQRVHGGLARVRRELGGMATTHHRITPAIWKDDRWSSARGDSLRPKCDERAYWSG